MGISILSRLSGGSLCEMMMLVNYLWGVRGESHTWLMLYTQGTGSGRGLGLSDGSVKPVWLWGPCKHGVVESKVRVMTGD